MKFLPHLIVTVAMVSCVACTSMAPATPGAPVTEQRQKALDATYTSYMALDQAVLAADAAVKSGTLKGKDAQNALAGFKTAKVGLDAALTALTITAAPAASGVK